MKLSYEEIKSIIFLFEGYIPDEVTKLEEGRCLVYLEDATDVKNKIFSTITARLMDLYKRHGDPVAKKILMKISELSRSGKKEELDNYMKKVFQWLASKGITLTKPLV